MDSILTACRGGQLSRIFIQSIWANVLLVRPNNGAALCARLLKVRYVLQLLKYTKVQERDAVIEANLTIGKLNLKRVIVLCGNCRDSRIHGYRYLSGSILNGCWPLTASCQSASNSSR